MVISCPECSTRFRVDESKIPERGAKIRCARCKHIFAVAAPVPEPAELAEIQSPVTQEPTQPAPVTEEPPAWDKPTPQKGSAPAVPQAPADDFSVQDEPAPEPAARVKASAAAEDDFGFDDFESPHIGAGANDDFDLSAFDSTESTEDDDDFSFGEEYGNVSLDGEDDSASDEEDEPFTFGEPLPASAKTAQDVEQEQFSFTPAQASTSIPDPLAESFKEDASPSDLAMPPSDDEFNLGSDVPPAPSTVKKSSSRGPLSIVIMIILMLILAIVVAGGVLMWKNGPEGLEKIISTLTGHNAVSDERGNIRLTNLQGSFITNNKEGELFVIRGNAINDIKEAQAAIQVKGVIFDKAGKQLMQKTIFCGNPISDNDLRKLPFSKMEEIMGNQFGESLANLNVTTGQSIPFTIVFRKLPKTLSEFVVEVADSKPAAQ